MRTTRESITFDRPFSLAAVDEVLPAGTYTVEIDEELIEALSFLAYRRVATTLYVPILHGGQGSMQAITVDPGELVAAHDLAQP
jgi:hypothetical protein